MSDPTSAVVRPQPLAENPAAGQVRVRYWAGARQVAGVEFDLVTASSVAEALAATQALRPGLAAVHEVSTILVDGLASEPSARVAPGSVLEVLPPFAGG